MTVSFFAVFGALSLSILTAFSKLNIQLNKVSLPVWSIPFSLSLVAGLSYGVLEWVALIPIAIYFFLGHLAATTASRAIYSVAILSLLVFGLALAMHAVPGFNNKLVYENITLGQYSNAPFTLYANFDKATVGLALVSFLIGSNKNRLTVEYNKTLMWPLILGICILVNVVGYLLGLQFDFKLNQSILVFYWFNLLFTCVAEEAFFRLLIQDNISKLLHKFRWGPIVAVVVTTALFVLAHLAGITQAEQGVMVLIAGLAYAAIYEKTKSLPLAITTHFGVNAIHITFLTYPMVF